MRITFLFVLSLFVFTTAQAQSKFLFTNAQKIDPDRYKGIKGSPYLYEEWPMATIYDNAGLDYVDVQMNFNGETNEIEIRKGDKFIELEKTYYKTIKIEEGENKTFFFRQMEDYYKNDFLEIVYEGKKMGLVRKFEAKLEEVEIQNVGKTEKIKRFNRKFKYILIKDGKSSILKTKKKQIIAALGKKKQLDSFIDNGKLKKDKLGHLKEIIAYYESIL